MKWVFQLVSHRDDSSSYSTETSSNSETSLDLTDDTQQQQSYDQESDQPPSEKRKRESDELEDALSATYDPNLLHYQIQPSSGNAESKKRLRTDPLHGEASLSLAMDDDDLRLKLLYLENTVGLAKLLFPMEAKIAMNIAPVDDDTCEFTLTMAPESSFGALRTTVDLNEVPFIMQEEHLNRMRALSRTVELGKQFFPRCSEVLNTIMEAEEFPQLMYIANETIEDRRQRQRYTEFQDLLRKAFNEDNQEFDGSNISSSSSS